MKNVQTLKGFRDFLPEQMRKRQYVIGVIKNVFESYGFDPLETPALEYEDILLGKYGEEGDKLLYRFVDNGDRKVALRYDQTVPTARVAAQYQNTLPNPFKRYQIQPVWRAENTQKGRYREFLQCDGDIIGVDSPLADAEVIAVTAKILEELGFKNYKILINDRTIFEMLAERAEINSKDLLSVIRTIDKLKKIGREGVLNELGNKGFSTERAMYILQTLEGAQKTNRIQEIESYLTQLGINKNSYEYSPTLARGLDYYTGLIFEIEIPEYPAGSIAGGGRYNNLIGMFAEKQIPAVGFAFGFDRLLEAMDALSLFPNALQSTQVLVTIFSPDLIKKSIEVCTLLRKKKIKAELFVDADAKLEKQFKYADLKNIPYAVVIGPDEAISNTVKLKNLQTREQKKVTIKELPNEIKS